jgi:pimeloyl-ACP methyl ester carboxylesterase
MRKFIISTLWCLQLSFSSIASMSTSSLKPLPLPEGVNSSYVDTTNTCGLLFHILSSGYDPLHQKPLILLLHGAPELAFTWRHIIAPLAAEGYHVVAPDQRGYGRTTGWDTRPYDSVDLTEFHISNLVRDLICLTYALGYTEVHSIISHDFGTLPGTYAPLLRPDIFTSSVQVSIPFVAPAAPAAVPEMTDPTTTLGTEVPTFALFEKQLEALDPPRKHYQWFNSQPSAASDWITGDTLGLKAFYRGYFYLKSHQWPGNAVLTPPTELTAQALAVMPDYLILPENATMPDVVEKLLKGYDPSVSESWISDADVDVFVSEMQRVGFQGELNWYRVLTSTQMARDSLLSAGGKLRVPTTFITGANDWSSYLIPGSIEKYNESCTDFRGTTVIPNAGHWVPEEQPDLLREAILSFLKTL